MKGKVGGNSVIIQKAIIFKNIKCLLHYLLINKFYGLFLSIFRTEPVILQLAKAVHWNNKQQGNNCKQALYSVPLKMCDQWKNQHSLQSHKSTAYYCHIFFFTAYFVNLPDTLWKRLKIKFLIIWIIYFLIIIF